MSIVTETGQAAADSVSYCSVADADAHHLARNVATWAALTTGQKESALVRGCDYITQMYRTRWTGYRVNTVQALDWPRYWVPRLDQIGFSGGVNYYPSDSIPAELRNANAELALRASTDDLLADQEPLVQTETVGPISTTYFQGASRAKKYPAIERILAPLLGLPGGPKLVRA